MKHRLALIVVFVSLFVACGGGGSSSGTGPSPIATPTPTPVPTPTPTPTNRPPTVNAATFGPSFGIAFLTTFTGTATATDPDGDALTYNWDFGDGTTSQAQNPTKTYNGSGGSMNVRLTVSDGKALQGIKGASATVGTTIIVGSMTGTWNGTLGPTALGTYRFMLTQNGGVVTGTYWDSTYGNGALDPAEPGSIDGSGNVRMRVKQGRFTDWYFTGTMDNTGRRITGTVRGSGFTGQPFAIEKQ